MDLINQFVTTAPTYACLFWAGVFAWEFRQNSHRPERRIMCCFMLVATVLYFGHFCYFNHYISILPLSDTLYSGANLSVYPLYYLYVRRITTGRPLIGGVIKPCCQSANVLPRPEGSLPAPSPPTAAHEVRIPRWRTPLWLLLPALLMLLTNALAYALLPQEDIDHFLHECFYGKIEWHDQWHLLVLTHRLGTLLFFVLLVGVLWRSMRLLKAFRQRLQSFYSNTEHRDMGSLMRLQTALLFTTFGSVVLNAFGKAFFDNGLLVLTIPSVVFTLLLFSLGYDAYNRPFTAENFDADACPQDKPAPTAPQRTHLATPLPPPAKEHTPQAAAQALETAYLSPHTAGHSTTQAEDGSILQAEDGTLQAEDGSIPQAEEQTFERAGTPSPHPLQGEAAHDTEPYSPPQTEAYSAPQTEPYSAHSAALHSDEAEAARDTEDLPQRILEAMRRDMLYLDPDLKLPQLARHLGTNRNYLYQAISQDMGTNFSDLVNGQRIEHAKRLMQEPGGDMLSNAEIAAQSGFASESSFYRHFRRVEGITPTGWNKRR